MNGNQQLTDTCTSKTEVVMVKQRSKGDRKAATSIQYTHIYSEDSLPTFTHF